jgi:hypothetical protein
LSPLRYADALRPQPILEKLHTRAARGVLPHLQAALRASDRAFPHQALHQPHRIPCVLIPQTDDRAALFSHLLDHSGDNCRGGAPPGDNVPARDGLPREAELALLQ